MDFIALDFETANNRGDSICSIGMSRFSNGKEVDRYYQLINPLQPFYSSNIAVHGIYPEDVHHAPRFDQIYDEIRGFIGDNPLVAHYAPFDVNCLQKTIERYHLPKLENDYFCSCAMAKRLLDLSSNSLVSVLAYYDLTIDHHHHAGDDAKACGLVANRLLRPYDGDIERFLTEHNYQMGKLFSHRFGPVKATSRRQPAPKRSLIQPTSQSFDPSHPFYKKHVCFTGRLKGIKRDDAAQIVANAGGYFDSQLSYETTYVVVAMSDWQKIGTALESRKIQMVRELQGQGRNIHLLSEDDFRLLIK
ncbi:hypothetical protein BW721_07330 [Jeotgalibaca sp. PTS2502]|uniref:exonuclease domain-containing protein n=1 Tax=Jeotgalibaca sp. PTS2502 TaxID=1903686 RepID=UPI000973955A|nr:exonuclease domain-containing protein [Jeotgalibaca sp. PTS2502]APZ49499.1 hypothetical protein BW721_07330 [Jeotgalibaca sp. PTS2502]